MARLRFRPSISLATLRPLAGLAVILALVLAILPAGAHAANTSNGPTDIICQFELVTVHDTDCAPLAHYTGCIAHAGCQAAFTLPGATEIVAHATPQCWTSTTRRNPAAHDPSVTTPPPIPAI